MYQKKKGFLLALVLVVLTWANIQSAAATTVQNAQLSDQARISLLTMWPSAPIYITFGHSAFRVVDPATNLDRIYNYGTFDMRSPLFVPKFVYGQLDYFLNSYDFELEFDYERRNENRKLVEQVLALERSDTQKVFEYLEWNALPENRVYRYDFMLDNCSTRIRDVLVHILGDRISFAGTANAAPMEAVNGQSAKTFRSTLDEFVGERPGWQFSFYLVLGTSSDKRINEWESMYLPFYLMHAFDKAVITDKGQSRPLVLEKKALIDPDNPTNYAAPWTNPAIYLWPVFGFALFLLLRRLYQIKQGVLVKSHWYFRLPDFLFFLLAGSIALINVYLDFFSIHFPTKGNLTIFWLWPTHFFVAFLILAGSRWCWLRWYYRLASAAALIPLLLFPLWPQALHLNLTPLLLIIAARMASYSLLPKKLS